MLALHHEHIYEESIRTASNYFASCALEVYGLAYLSRSPTGSTEMHDPMVQRAGLRFAGLVAGTASFRNASPIEEISTQRNHSVNRQFKLVLNHT